MASDHLDFSGDLAGGTTMAGDYGLSNKKTKQRSTKEEPPSEALSDGSEHRSTVAPGELPGILRDGFKECACCVVCFTLEYLIGAQGKLFGAAKDKKGHIQDKKAE